jgi:hypothetical protein
MSPRRGAKAPSFVRQHSLSLVVALVLLFWLVMYLQSNPSTHAGAVFGNAIADWLGMLVFIIATKYFFEIGSGESRRPHPHVHVRVGRFLVAHSLTFALAVTGAIWVVVFARQEAGSKSGQVLGSIVSEWTQLIGLVVITKYTREAHSKEGSSR